MPKQRIIGRVSGRDIAPSNFQDGLRRMLDEQAEGLEAFHKVGSLNRFGAEGMVVRISDMLETFISLHSVKGENTEKAANALAMFALVLLAMHAGVWELPERLPFTDDDEEEEFLREH
jgi:hypothetical protein